MDLAALQQLPLPEFLQQLYHRQLKTTVADSFLARVLDVCASEGVTTPTMLLEGHAAFFELNRLTYLYGLLLEYKRQCASYGAEAPPAAKKPRVASVPAVPVEPERHVHAGAGEETLNHVREGGGPDKKTARKTASVKVPAEDGGESRSMCSRCRRAGHSAKSCTGGGPAPAPEPAPAPAPAPAAAASVNSPVAAAPVPPRRAPALAPMFVAMSVAAPRRRAPEEEPFAMLESTPQPPKKRGGSDDMAGSSHSSCGTRPDPPPPPPLQPPPPPRKPAAANVVAEERERGARWASLVRLELMGHWMAAMQQDPRHLSVRHAEDGSFFVSCALCDAGVSAHVSIEPAKTSVTRHVLSDLHQSKLARAEH